LAPNARRYYHWQILVVGGILGDLELLGLKAGYSKISAESCRVYYSGRVLLRIAVIELANSAEKSKQTADVNKKLLVKYNIF
jgi:hypothetical protein